MSNASEQESRRVAEESRQTEWTQPSFMREMFLGAFRPDLLPDFPLDDFTPEFQETYDALKDFLINRVDPVAIDETGEYPESVLDELRRMGAFGYLVPKEYGGHGVNKTEWCKLMELVASYEGNLLGLMLGGDAIPEKWLAELEMRAEIKTVAGDLYKQFEDTDAWRDRYPGW